MVKYGKLADDLHTDLHECLGHGSGQLAPGVKGGELKSYSSTLEETRADLFGLYYLGDPKMVELGLVPSFDVAKAGYANGFTIPQSAIPTEASPPERRSRIFPTIGSAPSVA